MNNIIEFPTKYKEIEHFLDTLKEEVAQHKIDNLMFAYKTKDGVFVGYSTEVLEDKELAEELVKCLNANYILAGGYKGD